MDNFIVEDEESSIIKGEVKDIKSHIYYDHGQHHFHPHRQYSTALERKIRHSRRHVALIACAARFNKLIRELIMSKKNKEKSNQIAAKEWREKSELLAVPEDEREHPPHSLPRLSIVLPCSNSSSSDHLQVPPRRKPLSHGDESMTVVLSAFYAKLLIVLGVAFPVTSTIQNVPYTNITSDIFTMYLYALSMIFLAYTFYHLRLAKRNKDEMSKRTRYGSFYLHMGIAGFSVGSIIYSSLQFGGYFDLSGDCQLVIVAIKPALRIMFVAAQTVFIFSYTDILDPMRGVVLDRFGLMHLIATNVCEWLNVVIQETRDDILAIAYNQSEVILNTNTTTFTESNLSEEPDDYNISLSFSNSSEVYQNVSLDIKTWTCNVSDMITPLIRTVNPYLRPCGVEYSLLCSVIIFVIWNDVCTVPGSKVITNDALATKDVNQCCNRIKSNNHFSVDCGSAHKGLFMGIAVLAGTIVSLMLFNGLFHNQNHIELALLQINVWETILFILMTIGSAICIQKMRSMKTRRTSTATPLEHALLLVTQCGVYVYYLFQIIGTGFFIQRFSESRRATRIIAPLCAVIQSSCQTLLVLDAWSRRCDGGRERPGRQLVTFLLVGNFALWLLNRVKNARAEFHPLQMEFYGIWAWTLITHVSVPLLVCYRFQATVCFYEIWKNSYKKNRYVNDISIEEIELKSHHTA